MLHNYVWSDASERYHTIVADIFSAENKLQLQLLVEAKLAKTQSKLGIISEAAASEIANATTKVQLERVKEIEAEIHHDLMAMVKALSEKAGSSGELVHLGATSNDIQDTVLALQMKQAKEEILDLLDQLSDRIVILAEQNISTNCIGRTHGQFAVPTTLGFKLANYLYELQLAKLQLQATKVGSSKFSGAVGNYAGSMRLDIEKELFSELGLNPVSISTQVVSRTIHSTFLHSMALVASVIERLAKEVRNLQRSEINEWLEPFSSKQIGSSAMPHKRNPHKSERISGLARIIRSNVAVGLENISLEHERDITHSSVERIIIPESCNLLYYIARSMKSILENIEFNYQAMEQNLQKAEKGKSEQILNILSHSIGRQKGHELLRNHLDSENFKVSITNDPEIVEHISKADLDDIFNMDNTGLAVEKTNQIIQLYRSDWRNYRL